MSKRFLMNWSIWIGIMAGIYCSLYMISPLGKYGIICATFTAFPIFFTAGAPLKEYVNYAFSSIIGVGWGLTYLFSIEFLQKYMPVAIAFGIGVLIVTVILVAFHTIVTEKTWFNKVPAMFGATSCTFWIHGETSKLIPLIITLILGVTLALVCHLGTNFLTEEGKWKWPDKIQ